MCKYYCFLIFEGIDSLIFKDTVRLNEISRNNNISKRVEVVFIVKRMVKIRFKWFEYLNKKYMVK